MKILLNLIEEIDEEKGGNLYKLPAWNRLQYMVAKFETVRGRWNPRGPRGIIFLDEPQNPGQKEMLNEARLLFVISKLRHDTALLDSES